MKLCATILVFVLATAAAPEILVPIRPVLEAGSPAEASELRQAVDGKRMSVQAWGIVRKVREVDEVLRANCELSDRVREVHPEVCFYFMTGGHVLQFAKKRREGQQERCRVLRPHFGVAIDEAIAALRSEKCTDDDILDAFAALWTAQRIVAGKATTVPTEPGRDRFGLRMEIVA